MCVCVGAISSCRAATDGNGGNFYFIFKGEKNIKGEVRVGPVYCRVQSLKWDLHVFLLQPTIWFETFLLLWFLIRCFFLSFCVRD